jgi:uncharacterized protein YgiM (DUF1202 family)
MKNIRKIITFIITTFIITLIITTMAMAGTVITVKVAKAQLRQSATTKAKVIYNVGKGTNFAVLKTVKGWYQVKYKNKTLWVSSGQVAVKPAAPKPAPNNGYKVPPKEDTDLEIETPKNDPLKVELEVSVALYEDVEPQYKDLEQILLSKFDNKTVNEVISYMKHKTMDEQVLEEKNWHVNGKTINVGSEFGNVWIPLTVYGK